MGYQIYVNKRQESVLRVLGETASGIEVKALTHKEAVSARNSRGLSYLPLSVIMGEGMDVHDLAFFYDKLYWDGRFSFHGYDDNGKEVIGELDPNLQKQEDSRKAKQIKNRKKK